MSVTAIEREKRAAAGAAVLLVENGMRVGLGTGSTVGHFLPALAARRLEIVCVATSPQTDHAARELGLAVEPFEQLDALDLAVDGADQISPDGWLVKGGGGAHTREKVVAASAARFVVIASSDKLVAQLHAPVPLELLPFGLEATLRRLGDCRLRDVAPTADGGAIADYFGAIGDPAELATWLGSMPGVVEHGLFAPELVSEILVARADAVERRLITPQR